MDDRLAFLARKLPISSETGEVLLPEISTSLEARLDDQAEVLAGKPLRPYRYRDFVIRAFNDDVPFDQFVQWQIAGDEIEPNNPEAVAATSIQMTRNKY